MSQLFFIPEKLKIGFVKRSETFDGQLSYVIFYDEKGVLRKEKSWQGWRDKSIEPIDVPNTPVSGLSLNKSIRRYGYHFGGGRNMIRVYDPRGFEYEITPDNLLGIMNHVDVLKGELQGEFVYSYSGSDMILLPVNSEQYKAAKQHTENKNTKVSAKSLIAGQVYPTKSGGRVLYLGKHWFNTFANNYYFDTHRKQPVVSSKIQHVFKSLDSEKANYMVLSASNLGVLESQLDDETLADEINAYSLTEYNVKLKGLGVTSCEDAVEMILEKINNAHYNWYLTFTMAKKEKDLVDVTKISLNTNSYHSINYRLNYSVGSFKGFDEIVSSQRSEKMIQKILNRIIKFEEENADLLKNNYHNEEKQKQIKNKMKEFWGQFFKENDIRLVCFETEDGRFLPAKMF